GGTGEVARFIPLADPPTITHEGGMLPQQRSQSPQIALIQGGDAGTKDEVMREFGPARVPQFACDDELTIAQPRPARGEYGLRSRVVVVDAAYGLWLGRLCLLEEILGLRPVLIEADSAGQ